MTLSYGEQAAAELIDEHADVVMAALDGNLEALRALVGVAATTAYAGGLRAGAEAAGVTL